MHMLNYEARIICHNFLRLSNLILYLSPKGCLCTLNGYLPYFYKARLHWQSE